MITGSFLRGRHKVGVVALACFILQFTGVTLAYCQNLSVAFQAGGGTNSASPYAVRGALVGLHVGVTVFDNLWILVGLQAGVGEFDHYGYLMGNDLNRDSVSLDSDNTSFEAVLVVMRSYVSSDTAALSWYGELGVARVVSRMEEVEIVNRYSEELTIHPRREERFGSVVAGFGGELRLWRSGLSVGMAFRIGVGIPKPTLSDGPFVMGSLSIEFGYRFSL